MVRDDWLIGGDRRAAAADRIYAAATELALRDGLDGFDIDSLAARMHCSRATIYRYAGSKAQIRDAVLVRLAARVVDTVRHAAEVVFIGGRSGVGKSSVGFEMHSVLSAAGIRHCVIDGDMLDMAYPAPWEYDLAERNLAAMWTNYRSLGYKRLIYMNSASVLPGETSKLVDAMGDALRVMSILLTWPDTTARKRLGWREVGAGLDVHLKASADMADLLHRSVDGSGHQVATDSRTVAEVAADVVAWTGWLLQTP